MKSRARKERSTPLTLLIHLIMAPSGGGTFSWEIAPDQLSRLAEDLRWLVLRKISSELNGKSPYGAFLQKHSIRIESLDIAFFREILLLAKQEYGGSFNLHEARELTDIQCLEHYFIPLILEWAESERSLSVSREKTPSIEDLITCEDSSGNIYQRFPEEFSWVLQQSDPTFEKESRRIIPEEMRQFTLMVASELRASLKNIIDSGRLDKYIILMSRLEDDICTWDMTFDYLKSLGISKYTSWKSLSVVANRAMKEFVGSLPGEVKAVLHQDDPGLTREEKHHRLRLAVGAALELDPLPTPKELLSNAG